MEDGDGIAVPSQSDLPEDDSSRIDDSEDSALSKTASVRDNFYSNSDKSFPESSTFRNFVSFSNINGDCNEKNVTVPDRVLASSSTNSLSSVYSETTRDSIHDESSVHKDADSGSEDGSRSSLDLSIMSLTRDSFNFNKTEDSPHKSSDLSDSSTDSDSSDSDDSCEDDGENNENSNVNDDSKMDASPARSNTCGDLEKDLSLEADIYEEADEQKSIEEPQESLENNNDNITNDSSDEQSSISSPSESISDLKSDPICEPAGTISSEPNISKETEDEPSLGEVKTEILSSPDNQEKTIECNDHTGSFSPPSSANADVSSVEMEGADNSMEIDTVEKIPQGTPEAETEPKKDIQDVSDPSMKDILAPDLKDVSDPNLKDVSDSNLKDVSDPILKDILDPNLKDVPGPNMKEVSDPNLKDDLNPNSKDVSDPNLKDISVANMKEVSDHNVKDVSDPNLKDIPDADMKEVSDHNVKDVSDPNLKDIPDADMKEVSDHNVKDVSDPNLKDIPDADMKEVSDHNVKDVSDPNLKDIPDANMKEVSDHNVKDDLNPNSKDDTNPNLKNDSNDNAKPRESVPPDNIEKSEERVDICELGKQFSIQYKGFKTTRSICGLSSNNKNLLKSNPFNPAWKRSSKTRFGSFQNCRADIDCSTLQPEYAQYLGLQPIVKFKCSNCGMSTFQTMSALNTHQVECKKNGKIISHNNEVSPSPDMSSANIKLTRKVFLCSTCGTYYENCDLFLHMREFHRRYICLFCLFMAPSPDSLHEHLKEKHNVINQNYSSLEELQKHSPQTFYLLCFRCDRVFSEIDDSVNHKCTSKNTFDVDHNLFKKPRTDNTSYQDSSNEMSSIYSPDFTKLKTPKISFKENAINSTCFPPVANDTYHNEDENKDAQGENFNDNKMEIDNDILTNKNESHDIAMEAEHLQLKVPSGIEIKPLVPGENISVEKNENRSAIEIFPISSDPIKKKFKLIKKTKKIIKKTIRKKPSNIMKIKKEMESLQNTLTPPEPMESEVQPPTSVQSIPEPAEEEPPVQSPPVTDDKISPPLSEPTPPPVSADMPEVKRPLSQDIFKIKLPGEIDSDGESDDSQKLSLVVDENTNNSDSDLRKSEDIPENDQNSSPKEDQSLSESNGNIQSNEITLAREDVAAMALTLDDKIENVPVQAVVKECVRTSCLSCNYCRHACKIAVNGKQLALHLLSEHRYTPVKNETHDDVVRKLSSSLEQLQNMYFNTETYDSSDPSIHIPYDQEKNYDCFQCSYVSSSHKDLYAHKRKCHTKSLLLCIMCKSNFYSYSELICHICPGSYSAKVQFHNVDLIFRCCFCRLDTIPSAFRLMVHLRKSHHTCDICLELCTDQQKLSTHMWKHKLNHLCYRCGIAYASKPDITKHLFWKHGTESVLCKKCLQKKWPHVYHFCIPPTSFICEECNTSFSKAVALKVHKRIHGNDYPYSCELCEKKFVSKKLLNRHIDRHNAIAQKKEKMLTSPNDEKEEIINVTDLNDSKECLNNENSDINKETDGKDKGHKKHKKEKDKKEKKVVDVYDLPPLNLSSESDSSDEEDSSKTTKEVKESNSTGETQSDVTMSTFVNERVNCDSELPKIDGSSEDNKNNSLPILSSEPVSGAEDNGAKQNVEKDVSVLGEAVLKPSLEPIPHFSDTSAVNALLPLNKDEGSIDEVDSKQNDQVEGIWENFYKTNPQNSKLPFPLCAMKSEVAYSIIMGDHDYCQQVKIDPVIKDLPSASNLVTSLSDDKLEEVTPIIPEKPPQTPPHKEQETPSTPTSISKKKLKSPKKKLSKTPDDVNSSSSSDSSSDSDTSSCSCGTNCSCSSSSSNSSSSSSSDSDSSTNDDKAKQDKRKKRKDKKVKSKSETEGEAVKETAPKEPELALPVVPEDPPIRESELETDETTSDEEFYDKQPQIIANQMLAEKRQMVLLASGAPVNNGSASPKVVPPQEPVAVPPPAEPVDTPKQKTKPKRKRKLTVTPKVVKTEKLQPLPDPYPKFLNESKSYSPFQQTITTPKQKLQMPIPQSPSLPEAGGSGPETDNTRLSKRRRVPNKFYGYSSGEEEDTPKQAPKWRKVETQMTPVQTPKIQANLATPTPRIQLTVPKQVIRKPTYHKANMKAKQRSTSESSDSGASDVEDRIPRPPADEPIKADKDVYCYCRCPYDEVSEMIACDDANCKIEWFHFECVGILVPPRGQWFCPGCRKARGLPT